MNISSKDFNKVWVSTDWHLNHKNIIGFEKRPLDFKEQIIKNHTNMISENDLLINLGDVIFAKMSDLFWIMAKIKGKKVLTLGNHDHEKAHWYKTAGFDIVCQFFYLDNIVFSHRPLDLSHHPHCEYNIHGHFHRMENRQGNRRAEFYDFYSKQHLLLGIDDLNYKPLLLEEFLKNKLNA